MKQTLGLYIHIPFCLSKCIYCDFYSLPKGRWQMDRYVDALFRHLKDAEEKCRDYRVDTVYCGGGTPSCLGPERLARIMKTIRENYETDLGGELTMEANPESASDVDGLRMLREAGFNRVSLGVQSADDGVLRRLGRQHTFQGVETSVKAIRAAGFENLSLDLIYGLPEQTMEMWRETLDKVMALEPDHLSCYGLQIEEGTPLWKMQSRLTIPDDDVQADMYLYMVEYLKEKGFAQYEVSNFAREDRYSRHNMKYWTLSPYLGFGPGAHSDFGGQRFSWPRDLEQYCGEVESGIRIPEEPQPISMEERRREYLLLGLRTVHGICAGEYGVWGKEFGPLETVLKKYAGYGYTVQEGERWHFAPKGFLVSNRIIGEILEAGEN